MWSINTIQFSEKNCMTFDSSIMVETGYIIDKQLEERTSWGHGGVLRSRFGDPCWRQPWSERSECRRSCRAWCWVCSAGCCNPGVKTQCIATWLRMNFLQFPVRVHVSKPTVVTIRLILWVVCVCLSVCLWRRCIVAKPLKAPSTPATISKQQATFVEATFDFVAINRNNVERVYRKISSCRQSRMLLRHCCRFWRQCCRFRQQCRTKFRPFDKVEANWTLLPKPATMSKQH